MRILLAALALSVASCAGGNDRWNSIYGMPGSAVDASRESDRANTIYGMPGSVVGEAAAPTPPMDPKRKVADEDCSRSIGLYQGNLRCR